MSDIKDTEIKNTETTKTHYKNKYHEQHKNICKEIHNIYKDKDLRYRSSFHSTYQKLGMISALTRITDKYNRLINLGTNTKLTDLDESLRDTCLDLAGYLILLIMELDNQAKRSRKNENNSIS